jgi:hypothetical protein
METNAFSAQVRRGRCCVSSSPTCLEDHRILIWDNLVPGCGLFLLSTQVPGSLVVDIG